MKTTNLATTLAEHFKKKLIMKNNHITTIQAHRSMERISLITDLGQRQTQVNQLLDLIKQSDNITVPVYNHFFDACKEILAKK